MSRPGFMDSSRLDINLAIFKRGESKFEIVVDPDLAMEYKEGKPIGIREVLKSENIFSDAQKGNLASEHLVMDVFGTTDNLAVAEKIIKEGEIQLSGDYRRKLREQKKNRIIHLIHRNSINPQTNTPHTRERIESAMEDAKVKIDEFKSAEQQVEEILKGLKEILPIRYEQLKLEVLVEAKFAPQSYPLLKSFGGLESSQWLNDGSLMAKVTLPAGLKNDFFDKLNSLTHGSVDIKIIDK